MNFTKWFFIYGIGLALNLTPCVYPLLSVTVSLFRGQSGSSRVQAFFKAVIYVLGMATMYSALGVGAALSGGFFGSVLQKPPVQIAIAIFLFVLALSMLGVYTFQLPSWLTNRLSGARGANFIGLYLSGLFVGIFAAPCIGPPVIGLLTHVGTTKDPIYGFLVFFILSLGLGTPYLILGTFSVGLDKLPRAGAWLVWVEHLFGVILLGFSVFYLCLAVYPAGLKWLFPAALGLGGLYLGYIEPAGTNSPFFNRFKRVVGAVAIGVALTLAFTHAPHPNKASLVWESFSPARLEQAKSEGKPILVDFYADWCIPCHEMDNTTYKDPKVIEALSGFVRLKADMTDNSSKPTADLIRQFHIVGVPTMLFFNTKGEERTDLRIVGYVDSKKFIKNVEALKENPS